MLVVPPALHAVPWQLLTSLRGRPVVVAPSAMWWAESMQVESGRADGPALAVAGPRLVEAERRGPRCRCLLPEGRGPGRRATRQRDGGRRPDATASVAHIASHGQLRRDNPLWSSLELADGPLYGARPRVRRPDPGVRGAVRVRHRRRRSSRRRAARALHRAARPRHTVPGRLACACSRTRSSHSRGDGGLHLAAGVERRSREPRWPNCPTTRGAQRLRCSPPA